MKNQTLTFNLVGDEETAAGYKGLAQSLANRGIAYYAPDSMTTIEIHQGQATITVHMDCPYHLMVPQTVDEQLGTYIVGLLGYSHRKDAIVPSGRWWAAFSGVEGDYTYGDEATYISDGLCLLSAGIGKTSNPPTTYWMPESYQVVASINSGVMEDALYATAAAGNVGGFKTDRHYFDASRVAYFGGDNLYHVSAHQVLRSDPAAPVYVFLIAHSAHPYTTEYMQDSNAAFTDIPANAVTRYTEIKHRLTLLAAGKELDTTATYEFADDMYSLPTVNDAVQMGNDATAARPLAWGVANGKTIYLFRARTARASTFYGGTFAFGCYRFEGYPITGYAVATTGLTNTYFYRSWWSMHGADYPSTINHDYGRVDSRFSTRFWPWDLQRMGVLMQDFGKWQRNRIALSNTEIITFGSRSACHHAPTFYDHEGELVCFGITQNGFTQKGILWSGWSAYCYSDEIVGSARRIWNDSVRGVCIGNDTLIVFIKQNIELTSGGANWVLHGHFRTVSTDGGATWSAFQPITFNGVGQKWRWSLPLVVRTGLADDVTPLVAGYIEIDPDVSATNTLRKASVMLSNDGGLTWEVSSTAAPDINYAMPLNAEFVNGDGGLGTLHNHGSWEDGYEPSPYKNLPTYFGVPRAICRDSSNDAGL